MQNLKTANAKQESNRWKWVPLRCNIKTKLKNWQHPFLIISTFQLDDIAVYCICGKSLFQMITSMLSPPPPLPLIFVAIFHLLAVLLQSEWRANRKKDILYSIYMRESLLIQNKIKISYVCVLCMVVVYFMPCISKYMYT